MLILIAKGGGGGADTDQTASSVAVWSGSALSVFILPSGLIESRMVYCTYQGVTG